MVRGGKDFIILLHFGVVPPIFSLVQVATVFGAVSVPAIRWEAVNTNQKYTRDVLTPLQDFSGTWKNTGLTLRLASITSQNGDLRSSRPTKPGLVVVSRGCASRACLVMYSL